MSDLTGQISLVQALENGKGLQFLIDEAYKILGNPLVLFNMEYELLSSVKIVTTGDWLWNEIVSTGVFSDESIRFFLEEYFIDAVANTKSISLLTSDKLKYERLYGRVLNKYNNTVADLIMVACNKPFESQDALVFEAVCKKLSVEISANEFFTSYGILYHDKLIRKLLDDDIDDKVIYSGHLSNLYEDLKANIFVAAADIGNSSRLEEFRNLFKEIQPEFKYAVYSNHIVIIASTEESALNVERDLYKLNEYFKLHNICAGVSGCFENLFNLREYYYEAVNSLNQKPKNGDCRWIFPKDNAETPDNI